MEVRALQLKRGGPRRSSSGLESSRVIDLGSALETIVGARVGVWWDEDETYYKVRRSFGVAWVRLGSNHHDYKGVVMDL